MGAGVLRIHTPWYVELKGRWDSRIFSASATATSWMENNRQKAPGKPAGFAVSFCKDIASPLEILKDVGVLP
jgi:hypothetical protein